MRTVTYTFSGEPAEGDLLLISYRARRGGESTAKCTIVNGGNYLEFYGGRFPHVKDLESAVKEFAQSINAQASEWSPGAGDFKAHAKGLTLLVMCSALMDDVTFHFNQEGSMGTACEIEVMG